ncbi:MAG: AhpC/TSA family protein [Cyclobacteriaceae bacterium]|nr:AhpC/TSA family protein [Cyclobacteriaceae bacterium]
MAFKKMIKSWTYLLLWFFLVACSSGGEKAASNEEVGHSEHMDIPNITDLKELGIDESTGIPSGLRVGDKAPGFGARDISGEPFDLYSVLNDNPVVLIFYRGKWCPVCNRHMAAISDSVNQISQLGARVIAVTPELREHAQEFTNNTNLKFPVISDPGNNIMDAFKVTFKVTPEYEEKVANSHAVRISENNGTGEAFLPVPATYIIDKEGTITYAQFDLNFYRRATVKEIVAALRP